ncbi:4'-phosphopantetheinyl transferase family protein [Arthrobacter sp. Hz1]
MAVQYIAETALSVARALEPLGGLDRFLPASVRATAGHHQHEQDRVTYRAAHAVFRLLAARVLGGTPSQAAELHVTRSCRACGSDLHGKPAIGGVELSLSRSAEAILIASAPAGRPIGGDIERIPDVLFDGFDAYTLSALERDQFRPDDAGSRLRLWVAKEAVLKAVGHGLTVEPHTLTISGNSCLGLPEAQDLRLTWFTGPTGLAGYAAALAAPAGQDPSRLALADVLG